MGNLRIVAYPDVGSCEDEACRDAGKGVAGDEREVSALGRRGVDGGAIVGIGFDDRDDAVVIVLAVGSDNRDRVAGA